jgi:hypothetical protein
MEPPLFHSTEKLLIRVVSFLLFHYNDARFKSIFSVTVRDAPGGAVKMGEKRKGDNYEQRNRKQIGASPGTGKGT